MQYLCESGIFKNLFTIDLINIEMDAKRSFFRELQKYLSNL